MFVLLPLVTELALSVRNVFTQSVGAENPSWNLVALVSERVVALLHGPFVLVHC